MYLLVLYVVLWCFGAGQVNHRAVAEIAERVDGVLDLGLFAVPAPACEELAAVAEEFFFSLLEVGDYVGGCLEIVVEL